MKLCENAEFESNQANHSFPLRTKITILVEDPGLNAPGNALHVSLSASFDFHALDVPDSQKSFSEKWPLVFHGAALAFG